MSSAVSFLPTEIYRGLDLVHPSWCDTIVTGLAAMHQADPSYFSQLCVEEFLPSEGRLFAAFSLPMDEVRFILVGEGPYPRAESATGVCFMDGAVQEIWANDGRGLSKRVNRATSLRNFVKMLLVADGQIEEENTSGTALENIASRAIEPGSEYLQTLPEMQQKLLDHGFLLLNASLVFRKHVAPVKDGRSWQVFFRHVCIALHNHHSVVSGRMPALILWGKIAESLKKVPEVALFPQISSEHPYNLSFIKNRQMQELFRPMKLLLKSEIEKNC